FPKMLFGFTRKTDNLIHTDTGIRHELADFRHAIGVKFPQITALHLLQDVVASRLKRNMKMRNKSAALRYELNRLVLQQIRFDRRYPKPFNALNFVERLNEFKESMVMPLVAKLSLSIIDDMPTC